MVLDIDKTRAVCFGGHRLEKFSFSLRNMAIPAHEKLHADIKDAINKVIEQG